MLMSVLDMSIPLASQLILSTRSPMSDDPSDMHPDNLEATPSPKYFDDIHEFCEKH
jgi:hypothetical protein